MAHMKLEKISPNGSSLSSETGDLARALFNAADQKKMNRYMAPSKKQDVIPRDKILGSRNMLTTPSLTSARVLCSVKFDP